MKKLLGLCKRFGPAIEGALFFGVFAPPLGSIPLSLAVGIAHLFGKRNNHLLDFPITVFSTAMLSYIFGLVPALVVGAIAGSLRQSSISRSRFLTIIGIFGGIASLGYAVYIGSIGLGRESHMVLLAVFLIPGIFGGAITAAWFSPRSRGQASLQP